MADTTTPNYNLTLIEVGASDDTWGGKINANFGTLDTAVKAALDLATGALPKANGVIACVGNVGGTITFNTADPVSDYITPKIEFRVRNGVPGGALGNLTSLYADNVGIKATNPFYAPGFVTTSDARLKTAVERLDPEESLAAARAIGAHRYLKNDLREAGVIAQRLQNNGLGYLVSADSKGILSVNYNGLIAVLLAAVDALAQRIEANG